MLVEQNLAQLLVHNPNECGSDWAAVVEECKNATLVTECTPLALAITK